MGKSFNDDVFNNDFNLDTINGLNISKEAIEENKKEKEPSIDLKKLNIDTNKIKEDLEKAKQDKEQDRIKEMIKEKLVKPQDEQEKIRQQEALSNSDNAIYTKKTMIFKQEYLDIIDGLASINDMQIKDVLNQLLEKSINELDEATRTKALKTGKKSKPVKETKNIF